MGCVQRAVLEFDEEVRAPWRPRLVADVSDESPSRRLVPARTLPPHPSSRNLSRVGACRPSGSDDRLTAVTRRSHVTGVGDVFGARRSRRRLRLTRRARRLALVIAVIAGIALGSWLAPLVGDGSGSGLRLAGVTSVVVQPGDTLWSIASPVAAGDDVRTVVDEIRQLNGLPSADLVPGQVLQLP